MQPHSSPQEPPPPFSWPPFEIVQINEPRELHVCQNFPAKCVPSAAELMLVSWRHSTALQGLDRGLGI